jgi:uncharacterized protein with HEPN domain
MPRPDRPDRDQGYVEDIIDAARRIAVYLAGSTVQSFVANDVLIDAVVRRMGIIGEAAANLSQVYKTAHPDAHWREIISLRNLVVHAYWRVSSEKIWEYATKDVPDLAAYLSQPTP